MAFGRNLMVLGGIIFGLGGYGGVRGAMTLTWPRVPATITDAETVRQIAGAGGAREESWTTFRVLYRYRVGDMEYWPAVSSLTTTECRTLPARRG
jgi:hypothetical protein